MSKPDETPWERVADRCVALADTPTMSGGQLEEVREYARLHLPQPVPLLQPKRMVLVKLPLLVSVPDPGPRTLTVDTKYP